MPPQTSHGGNLATPWRQFIGRGWVGEATFSNSGESHAMLCWDTDWDNLTEDIAAILGYTKASNDTKRLNRVLPAVHPQFDWMYATAITRMEGIGPKERAGKAHGEYQAYDSARLYVQFSAMPYPVTPDGVQKEEHMRYVIKRVEPGGEFISRPKESFVLKYIPANDQEVIGSGSEAFDGQRGQVLIKNRLVWTWLQVPENYILNADGFPEHILGGAGRVNAVKFAGCGPGTLLAETPKLRPYAPAVDPRIIGGAKPMFQYYDVTFTFLHFDPPLGKTVPPAADNNPFAFELQGWNTAPWKANGLFYPIRTQDDEPQYKSYKFNQFFVSGLTPDELPQDEGPA